MLGLVCRVDRVEAGTYSRLNKRRGRVFLPGSAVYKGWLLHLRPLFLHVAGHVSAGSGTHRFRAVPHLMGDLPGATDILAPYSQSSDLVANFCAAPFGNDDNRYDGPVKGLIFSNRYIPIRFDR